MINNKFDFGKVASDLTSQDSLKSLGLNVMTAGLTAGIGHGIGLEELAPGMSLAERTGIIAKQSLINGAVRTGLAGATGEDVGTLWRDEALSGGLALGQSKIGDIAQEKGFKTGSFGKIAMHSVTGGIYSAATGSSPISGIIGGATSEIVAGLMESGKGANSPPLTQEQQQQLNNKIKATTKLVSATATLLAGGSAKDINTAANVGESAIKHNEELHESEQRALRELQAEATTDQERQDLEDAAAFKARIHAGVDPNKEPEIYAELYNSYKRGQSKIAAQKKLADRTKHNQKMDLFQGLMVPESMGGDSSKLLSAINARHFDYDWLDASIDSFTSNYNQASTRIGQTTQLFGGIGGAIGSGLLTFESIIAANTTGVAFGSVGMVFGYEYASDGLGGLLSPYKSDTGARAMASLKGELPGFTGKSRAALSLANTALDVGGITAGIKTVSILRRPKTSGTSGASQVKNNNSGDPSDLHSNSSSGSVSHGSGKDARQQNVYTVNQEATNPKYRVPGRVQSRVDLHKPGWEHTVNRHYNPTKNTSQYTISKTELREILQSKEVVHSPVKKILNTDRKIKKWAYLREVDVGKVIGIDKFTGKPTSKITILTDFKGKLRSASPGRLD